MTLQRIKPFLKQEMNSFSDGWLDIPSGPTKVSNQATATYLLKATKPNEQNGNEQILSYKKERTKALNSCILFIYLKETLFAIEKKIKTLVSCFFSYPLLTKKEKREENQPASSAFLEAKLRSWNPVLVTHSISNPLPSSSFQISNKVIRTKLK